MVIRVVVVTHLSRTMTPLPHRKSIQPTILPSERRHIAIRPHLIVRWRMGVPIVPFRVLLSLTVRMLRSKARPLRNLNYRPIQLFLNRAKVRVQRVVCLLIVQGKVQSLQVEETTLLLNLFLSMNAFLYLSL